MIHSRGGAEAESCTLTWAPRRLEQPITWHRKGATASRAPVVPGTAVAFRRHLTVGIAVSGSPDGSEMMDD